MWFVIKEKTLVKGQLVAGAVTPTVQSWVIDRKVDSLDEVESGEMFVKFNIKK